MGYLNVQLNFYADLLLSHLKSKEYMAAYFTSKAT